MLTDTLVKRQLAYGPVPVLIDVPALFRECMEALIEAGEVVLVEDRAGRQFWIRAGSPDVERIASSLPGRTWNVAEDPVLADEEASRVEHAYWDGLGG